MHVGILGFLGFLGSADEPGRLSRGQGLGVWGLNFFGVWGFRGLGLRVHRVRVEGFRAYGA